MKDEEIFPLVDEAGNIVGQEFRHICHNGSMLLHPVVHLHIFNIKGELYLQKRSPQKEIFPDLWDSSVGGHIDLGETPEQAVIREACEELGLENLSIKYITKHIIETKFEQELTYCYFAITNKEPQPDKVEVSYGRFWSIEEIAQSLNKDTFTPNFELDFNLFLSKGVDNIIS